MCLLPTVLRWGATPLVPPTHPRGSACRMACCCFLVRAVQRVRYVTRAPPWLHAPRPSWGRRGGGGRPLSFGVVGPGRPSGGLARGHATPRHAAAGTHSRSRMLAVHCCLGRPGPPPPRRASVSNTDLGRHREPCDAPLSAQPRQTAARRRPAGRSSIAGDVLCRTSRRPLRAVPVRPA